MPIWSKEDIELAKSLSKIHNEVKTPQEFDAVVSQVENKIKTECRAQCDLATAKKLEDSYQKLLGHVGGDADLLARWLYATWIKESTTNLQPEKSTKTGRPPNKWGRDGVGKLMIYYHVEEMLSRMRAEGQKKPKINEAVARVLQIPCNQRLHPSKIAKIKDYSSRYTEAKNILKECD